MGNGFLLIVGEGSVNLISHGNKFCSNLTKYKYSPQYLVNFIYNYFRLFTTISKFPYCHALYNFELYDNYTPEKCTKQIWRPSFSPWDTSITRSQAKHIYSVLPPYCPSIVYSYASFISHLHECFAFRNIPDKFLKSNYLVPGCYSQLKKIEPYYRKNWSEPWSKSLKKLVRTRPITAYGKIGPDPSITWSGPNPFGKEIHKFFARPYRHPHHIFTGPNHFSAVVWMRRYENCIGYRSMGDLFVSSTELIHLFSYPLDRKVVYT